MSGTTILMRLRQFQREQLFNLAADFELQNHHDYVHTVWWNFHSAFGNVPHEAGVKKTATPTARVVSDAWTTVDKNNHICPGYFIPVSDWNPGDSEREEEYKLYGSLIHDSDSPELDARRYPKEAYARFHIVFRGCRDAYAYYQNDTPRYDGDAAKQARTALRDVMSSAEHFFTYQHRTALFLLLVNVDEFRVMRWDRSGVVITEPVNYLRTIEGTRALLEVTYAFSKLSRAQQGIDTTAVRLREDSCGWKRMDLFAQPSSHDISHAEGLFDVALHDVFVDEDVAATYGASFSDDDTHLHRDPLHVCSDHAASPPVIPVLSHIREKFRKSLAPHFPRHRLTVDGRDYLVGRPFVISGGIISRGTRCYIALDWETQRLVFLKDCWRSGNEGVEQEGAILSKLNENGVPHVPTVVCYGDVYHTEDGCVEPQKTETSSYHPVTGSRRADLDVAPFADSVEQATPRVDVLERWFRDGEYLKPTSSELLPKRANSVQLPLDVWWNERRPDVHLALKKPASMPGLPAFPPSPDAKPPANPATTRGVKRSHGSMLAADQQKQGEDLRHMVHTRLVVKEICLPLTAELTSSRQLVRLVYGCVIAHGLAYQRCQYMHGDVSEGNMLIYPHVRRTDDGKYGVHWQGMLSDWEFARHSSQPRVLGRQPGTWHFLSAYRLMNQDEPTTIPDELESFVHVLVYGAVIRVQSNICASSIKHFMEYYFSGSDYDPLFRRPACPRAKRESVLESLPYRRGLSMSGYPITFSTPDGSLKNGHILNNLITQLLNLFHSRYVVDRWDRRPPKPREATPPPAPVRKPDPKAEWLWPAGLRANGGLPPEFQPPPPEPRTPPPRPETPPPSEETYADRAALDSHFVLASILYDCGFAKRNLRFWPPQDVVPDRRTEEARIEARRGEPLNDVAYDPKYNPMFEAEDEREAEAELAQLKRPDTPPVETGASQRGGRGSDASSPPDASSSRPTKRRRMDPVVDQAALLVAESSTQRVTRSRSAAQAAVSTRVTRSKSGKLPGKVSAGTSNGLIAGRANSSRASGGRETRSRGGTTSRDAPSKSRARQSRSRRS